VRSGGKAQDDAGTGMVPGASQDLNLGAWPPEKLVKEFAR